MKRILIVLGFVLFTALMLYVLYLLTGVKQTQIVPLTTEEKVQAVEDSLHSYQKEGLIERCDVEDEVFCAIERTVKCTLNNELSICDEDEVPGFIMGKTEDDVRPSKISFSITKIKPVPDTRDIMVYTKSDCDASWFGLCKGVVIYSLTPEDGRWKVNNIFALEE